LNFIIDHNLPPQWAKALKELSKNQFDQKVGQIIALRERFAINTPDIQWLQELGQEGDWAVISSDFFRKSKSERELIRQHGLSVFVLVKSWHDHSFWPRSAQLLHWWPKIVDQANSVSQTAVEVPWRVAGKFTQIRL
jgi:hypothetical protein